MKKAVLLVLCLALLVVFAGCSQQTPQNTVSQGATDAAPSPETTEESTSSPESSENSTEKPTAEPTPSASTSESPEAQASAGTGEMKEVSFNDVTFTYNDKNAYSENEKVGSIRIEYEPKMTFADVYYLEKTLPDDQSDMELDAMHAAYLSKLELQMKETSDVAVAGIKSKCTTATVKSNDTWLNFMLFTIPSGKGFVSFAYVSNPEATQDYSDEFVEMVKSIKIS